MSPVINGKKYDWGDLTVRMPQGILFDVESIDYDEELEVEAQYGRGRAPIGYSAGNWKGNAKLSMKREEYDRLVEYAGKDGIFKLKPFPVTASRADEDGKVKTDTLPLCKVGKVKNGGKQGDKNLNVDIDLVLLAPIKYNNVPSYSEK